MKVQTHKGSLFYLLITVKLGRCVTQDVKRFKQDSVVTGIGGEEYAEGMPEEAMPEEGFPEEEQLSWESALTTSGSWRGLSPLDTAKLYSIACALAKGERIGNSSILQHVTKLPDELDNKRKMTHLQDPHLLVPLHGRSPATIRVQNEYRGQRRRNLQRQTEEACKISAARSHGLSPRLSIAWCLKVAMLPERRKRDGVLQRLARTISSTSHRPLNIQYQGQDFSAPMSFENLRPWSRVSRIHRSVNFLVPAGHFAQPCNTIESETALMPVLTNTHTHTQTSQRIIDTCIQCTACSSCTAHSILGLHAFKPWCERRARRLKGILKKGHWNISQWKDRHHGTCHVAHDRDWKQCVCCVKVFQCDSCLADLWHPVRVVELHSTI